MGDATAGEYDAYADDLEAYAAEWDRDCAAMRARQWRRIGMCAVISALSLVIIILVWL